MEFDVFIWYCLGSSSQQFLTWDELKIIVFQRYISLKNTKVEQEKLANYSQSSSFLLYKEKFMSIIIDVLDISSDETVDRYMGGLRNYIREKLCTKEYARENGMIQDELKVETSKGSSILTQFPI